MNLEKEITHELFKKEVKPIHVRKATISLGDTDIDHEKLRLETLQHIGDVCHGCQFLASLLTNQAAKHDYTKLDNIKIYANDLEKEFKGDELLGWDEIHARERHHLNSNPPKDVNLIDVLEMLVDCCVAGAARSEEIFPVSIDKDLLAVAVQNTQKLIIDNISKE